MLSYPQKEALRQIKSLNEYMTKLLRIPPEHCWFNQGSLKKVTYRTLQTLKEKGFLECSYRGDGQGEYYRWNGQEVE